MTQIELCDICHTVIRPKRNSMCIDLGGMSTSFMLCKECGRPIGRFLSLRGLDTRTFEEKYNLTRDEDDL